MKEEAVVIRRKYRWKKAAAMLAVILACGAGSLSAWAEEIPAAAGTTADAPEPKTAALEAEETAVPFTEEETAYLASAKTLKVGYVPDRKPVSFRGKDGELAGISRSIFDRIEELSGLKFEYVELPGGSVTYEYLWNEGFDLVTGVEYNKKNQAAKGILMSNPYLSSRKVAVAREGLTFEADAKLSVAISTGSQTIKKVFHEQYPNFKFVDYATMEDCLDAVRNGKADLLIQNQYVAEYWLYRPIYNKLKVIPIIEMNDQLCFSAVTPIEKKDDAVWREKELQISIINKAIQQMTTGEVAGYVIANTTENMYEYTFGDVLYQYRHTFIALGVALVLIGILLFVNTHIRFRAVNDRADAKAKSMFLSTMSHEIRTPLNGLISLNYLMSQNLGDEKKLSHYLKQSSSVAQYLLSLVNNILDMSKLQEHKMDLEKKPVNLGLLLAAVESIEKSSMEEKELRFRMDVELLEPDILGDEIRIQQILVNVIDNARKYTPKKGSVTVKVRQEKTAKDEILTKVEIADTGRGMSEEFQKKIFDPFTQEQNAISKGNQGTGLGMAICALLAERMGGSLTVESALGEGSCFTFTFLAERAEPEEREAFAEQREQEAEENTQKPEKSIQKQEENTQKPEESIENPDENAEKPRILLAEDNELNGEILVELLEGAGFEVFHAKNGKETVEVFQASQTGEYGVILMDLLMPEMNGFEAAEAIRALDRPDAATVKIFACTANSFQEDKDKALASGMDDFITKPIAINDLLQKLEHVKR